MDSCKEEALARRRTQNRLAQRRFRWKQSQQKASAAKASGVERPGRAINADQGDQDFSCRQGIGISSGGLSIPESLDLAPEFGSPDRSCGAALYGNYTLLDFTTMDFLTPPPDSVFTHNMSSRTHPSDVTQWLDSQPFGPQHIDPRARDLNKTSRIPMTMPDTPSSIATRRRSSVATTSQGQQDITATASPASQRDPPPSIQSRRTSADETNAGGDPDKGWLTPLHSAAARGHDRIVRVLLQHQPDSDRCNARDSDGLTPLAHAITGGYEDVLSTLLSHGARLSDVAIGADGHHSALHWAVQKRREGCLRMLLEHCEANGKPVDVADGSGRTPLHVAVETGFEAGVVLLLQHGADLNSRAPKA